VSEAATIEQSVRTFLAENFPLGGDTAALGRDESLLDIGLIDSTGVLELMGFLEDTFELQISDDEVLPENLGSIAAIVRFVGLKA
jgi:acyl carrier protein